MKTYRLIVSSINFIGKQIDNIDENDHNKIGKLKYLLNKLQFEKTELNKWYKESVKNVKKAQK